MDLNFFFEKKTRPEAEQKRHQPSKKQNTDTNLRAQFFRHSDSSFRNFHLSSSSSSFRLLQIEFEMPGRRRPYVLVYLIH